MLAYLVIREGLKWSDVFRLVPGRTVTIGRAPTNQIVIKDERCSRNHAELFLAPAGWTLRDLDSRNGTLVGHDRVRGDRVLQPGDILRIAQAQLAFVHDLTQAFPDSGTAVRDTGPLDVEITRVTDLPLVEEEDEESLDSENVLQANEPTTITHRRDRTRFFGPVEDADDAVVPKVGWAAARLCRLAFDLANQTKLETVAQLSLQGLFESTKVDAGAVLLLPRGFSGKATGDDLQVVASRSDHDPTYYRISSFLSTMVMRDGEAILARNVEDDSTLSARDSQGEIHATSVLCAPIRSLGRVEGIIHLYSTRTDRVPDPEDLEFALAVADNVALALKNLGRQWELAENLTKTRVEIEHLRQQLGADSQIVGCSSAMARVQQEISRAAPSRATVLIRGESGVGKELVARAMHFASPRKQGPFVCLNCAALSESLLESELFGHEKGAFTGATDRKIGKFESAHGGTLMLDEIGEMSPTIQAKFLRVLEGHPFERVGGTQAVKVDVRVIAATNRDLEKAVQEKVFRRDLYFRLRVVEIVVPPLRKRPEDISELAAFFLKRFVDETGRRIGGFTPNALGQMEVYRWPGNVREMKNVVERAVVLARGDLIDVDDLNLSTVSTSSDSAEIPLADVAQYQAVTLSEIERRHILATLKKYRWNKSRAARVLGIERTTLDRKIRRYELIPEIRYPGDDDFGEEDDDS